ncbi:MAG: hypothetical protein RI842_00445 [Schleiferiaceae bacterium]|jgi:hypothetical protein|nr:hypothetical protein [Schleiferiaceae bacterium]MDR9441161.1 hypothetical protein [Schleiferiaceae bacterium]
MLKIHLSLVTFCLLAACCPAQVLEDKTEVLDAPVGEALWVQEAGTALYAYPAQEGWYRVRRKVYLPMAAWDGSQIAAGTALQNEDGDKIGETRRALTPVMADTVKRFRRKPRLRAILEGQVFKTKLAEGTLPEERLQDILQQRNRRDQMAGYEGLVEDFDLIERSYDGFEAWVLRAQHRSLKEPGDFRLILVYRGSLPFAVMAKGYPISMERPKETWEMQDMTILYSYNPTDEQKALMEEILFTHLAL